MSVCVGLPQVLLDLMLFDEFPILVPRPPSYLATV